MAMGAQPAQVLWMVLRDTLVLIVCGLAAGVPAMLALGPLLDRQLGGALTKHFLYELSARDPTTLALVSLALLLVGSVAGYVPAYRATRIHPVTALRCD